MNTFRSGHRGSYEFEKGSIRTIIISQEKGINALVGCPKRHFHDDRYEAGMNVLSYLFAKENG
ncbi:MAG: hypothetical protein A4E32_01976 [Methanomassiliicoccales archaeon PtaU1.Bin124]|nr:MAG: hypothetical protein A4E32_01976 [Methanomassiliicoccales archaeon PtaU1.Bin124]